LGGLTGAGAWCFADFSLAASFEPFPFAPLASLAAFGASFAGFAGAVAFVFPEGLAGLSLAILYFLVRRGEKSRICSGAGKIEARYIRAFILPRKGKSALF
jgi:hypothetical protein